MAEDLRREVCSSFDQLSRSSFKKSLTNILTLPLTSTDVEVYVYIIHEKATNYSDLSEVLANLVDAMVRKLPTETGVKTKKLLMERCQKMFKSPNADANTRTIIIELRQARSCGEKKMLQAIYNEKQ
jgi:hypothetical protein